MLSWASGEFFWNNCIGEHLWALLYYAGSSRSHVFLFIISYSFFKNLFSKISQNSQRCSIRKGALRNLAIFTGKHLYQSLFFNKVSFPSTLLKRRLRHWCFPVNFAKFLRTPFYIEHLWWLLLSVVLRWDFKTLFFKKIVKKCCSGTFYICLCLHVYR